MSGAPIDFQDTEWGGSVYGWKVRRVLEVREKIFFAILNQGWCLTAVL
jgi:hypothetical protein